MWKSLCDVKNCNKLEPYLASACFASRAQLAPGGSSVIMAENDDQHELGHEEAVELTEGAKEALKEELKDFLKELTKFGLWVLALTFVVLSTRNSAQIHSAALFLRAQFNLNDGAEGAPSSSGDGFWPYIIDATSKINQDDLFARERPSVKYRKLHGTTVLGSQLRQVRVSGASCSAFHDATQAASSVTISAPCFGSAGLLSSSSAFTKEWRPSFMCVCSIGPL